jgi:release factor glutamine methyltransferase
VLPEPAEGLRFKKFASHLQMLLQEIRIKFINSLCEIYDPSEAAAITQLVMDHYFGEGSRSIPGATPIEEDLQSQLEASLQRLLRHEPAQYVIEEAWFCGLRFSVNKDVLIPRPETEELVEWIIAGCRFPVDRLRILDIGTGSGCIAISLKRRIRKADVHALDISGRALELARWNADNLGAELSFHQLDFLAGHLPPGKFDIIVSNPPYIPESLGHTLAPNVRNFEPPEALFVPDSHPFVFYRQMAETGLQHLNSGGSIYAEIHQRSEKEIEKIFLANGYQTRLNKDMQGTYRMIRAWKDA